MAFLHLFHGGEKQGPCGPCEGDSKASPLQGRAAPNRPTAARSAGSLARRGRAYRTRSTPTDRPLTTEHQIIAMDRIGNSNSIRRSIFSRLTRQCSYRSSGPDQNGKCKDASCLVHKGYNLSHHALGCANLGRRRRRPCDLDRWTRTKSSQLGLELRTRRAYPLQLVVPFQQDCSNRQGSGPKMRCKYRPMPWVQLQRLLQKRGPRPTSLS